MLGFTEYDQFPMGLGELQLTAAVEVVTSHTIHAK